MSIADSQQPARRFDKLIAAWHGLLERIRALLPARWLVLLAGFGCIAYGQYMMEQRFVQGQPNSLAEQWNFINHIEIVNLTNVFAGLPYFLIGLILCAWVALPAAWKEGLVNWSARWPALREMDWGKRAPSLLFAAALMLYLLLKLGKHQYMPIYPFLWILALWLFTRVVWQFDRDGGVDLSPGLTVVDVLWILGLLALGIGIGAYALRDIPAIMIPDEGSFWENARAIALKQFQPVFFDSGVYTFPVASTILQGWLIRLFGLNVWGWRFSSVVAGVAAIIPLYLLGKEWFGRRVAVVSVILMLANPYFLSFLRMGYNNSQALLPVTLAVYLWAAGSRKGSYLYLWLAGLVAGLGFYTYSAVWIGMVTLCLGIVYLRVLRQISWKQSFGVLLLVLLAWGLAFAPRFAYTSSGTDKQALTYKVLETSFFSTFYARAYFPNADLGKISGPPGYPEIFYDPSIYRQLLLRGVVRTVLTLFDPHLVTEHFLISALSGVISPIFFAIGLVLFLRKWKQSRFGLSLIWLVSGLIFLSVIGAFPPRHTHMVSLIPVIALIAGAGVCAVMESLAEYLPTQYSPFRTALTGLLIAAVSLTIFYAGTKKYFVTMPQTYPPTFEDFVSWVAWQRDEPMTIVYLGPPNIPHRVAYLVSTQMVPHSYVNVDFQTFSPQAYITPGVPTVIFWEVNTQDGYEFLERVPKGFSRPVPFHDMAGNTIGYASANSPGIPVEWKPDPVRAWRSVTGTPARTILLLLLAGMLAAAVYGLRKRFAWPRLSFHTATQVEEDPTAPATQKDGFEVELSVRFRVSPRRGKDEG